jgi:hypothetical protein
MVWDGIQLTRFMKGYNNKGNVTFGKVMRMHEEDKGTLSYPKNLLTNHENFPEFTVMLTDLI